MQFLRIASAPVTLTFADLPSSDVTLRNADTAPVGFVARIDVGTEPRTSGSSRPATGPGRPAYFMASTLRNCPSSSVRPIVPRS